MDEQLTGESHCSRAGGKAIRAAGAVKRACKFLLDSDREFLIAGLSHPHLWYCQSSLFNSSVGAMEYMERSYNKTARIVTRMERSAPALAEVGWPTWSDSRETKQKQFVENIFETSEPKVLKQRFPNPLQGDMTTRAIERGELWEPPALPGISTKSFSVWAPRLHNEPLRKQRICPTDGLQL